jgi:hypothetical protein
MVFEFEELNPISVNSALVAPGAGWFVVARLGVKMFSAIVGN